MKRIVIVEDNDLYRESLKGLLLDFAIVGEAKNGNEVVPLVQTTNPDLIILDLSLPSASGIAVARQIRESFPNLKVLILTIHESEEYIQSTLQAGVDGYCLKDESREGILMAVKTVLDGKFYLSPTLVN